MAEKYDVSIMLTKEEPARNMQLKEKPPNFTWQQQSQGCDSIGEDSPLPPSSPPALPSASSTPLPRGKEYSPVASSHRSSDCSDSSVGWSLDMTGHEPMYLNKSFQGEYRKNQKLKAEPRSSARRCRTQGSEATGSASPLRPVPALLPLTSSTPALLKWRTQRQEHSPDTSSARSSDSSVGWSPLALDMKGREPSQLHKSLQREYQKDQESSETEKKTVGDRATTKNHGAGTASAAGDTEADAKLRFYTKFAMTMASTGSSGTEATSELLELKPVKTEESMKNASDLLLGAEHSDMPMSSDTVRQTMPQLVDLGPTDRATSPSVPSPMAQPEQLVQSSGATSQSVQRLNSSPLIHLPKNETDKPTMSRLPVTSSLKLVGIMAPLTYQLPGAKQDAGVKLVGPVTMTKTTDISKKSPYRLYPYSLPPNSYLVRHSANPSMLLIPSTQVGTPSSLQFSRSQQTISAVGTTATGSSMSGAVRSAPTAETTNPASNFCRQSYPDSSPVTTPTDPPVSATTSGAQTATSTSTVDSTMLSNLSKFRTSVAAPCAPKVVGRSAVSNVTHTQPAAMKSSDRAGTNRERTTAGKMVLLIPVRGHHPVSYYSSPSVSTPTNNQYLNTNAMESPMQRTQFTASAPSVDVSIHSNLVEFHARTGDQRGVLRVFDKSSVFIGSRIGSTASSVTTKAKAPSMEKESAPVRSSMNQCPSGPPLPSAGIVSVQNGQPRLPREQQVKQEGAVEDESELTTQPNGMQPLSCGSTRKQPLSHPGLPPRRQLSPLSPSPYGIQKSTSPIGSRPLLAQFIARRRSPEFRERPTMLPQVVSTPDNLQNIHPTIRLFTWATVAPNPSAGNKGGGPQHGTVTQCVSAKAGVPGRVPIPAGGMSCSINPEVSQTMSPTDTEVLQSVSPAPEPTVSDNGSDTRAHQQE